ncbi:hypothetical protein HBH70_160440 [Parastagonospora nodorum]|nr:hypothetical protein HBH53_153490 [Parastagonospora nodorum]KAH4063031.1 hypothetical protein HBH50_198600 [Parastagonospora nodorum]KAH4083465.1 hypothetical protein HBH48_175500 [Parastagonospora nodorum]KAH4117287.1 hypothetical protein HBH47_156730 [Parastagonospora nodorum]KAH4847070.1 hypothetical protein HBH75_164030 [Parastagonospora nodorum]
MSGCRVNPMDLQRTRSSTFPVGQKVKMKVAASLDGTQLTHMKRFVIKALRHTPKGYWEYQIGATEDEGAFEDGTWYPESSLKFDISEYLTLELRALCVKCCHWWINKAFQS